MRKNKQQAILISSLIFLLSFGCQKKNDGNNNFSQTTIEYQLTSSSSTVTFRVNYTNNISVLVPITCKSGWKYSGSITSRPFTTGFMAMPIDFTTNITYTQKILVNGKVMQEVTSQTSLVSFYQIQYTLN